MKIFISWSGERSGLVAQALRTWLPLVLHYAQPWLSETDISAGKRWAVELARTLDESAFGIICLTTDNINSRWLLFEAGALSKSLAESAVVPYLFDLDHSDITAPLSQFQAKKTDSKSTLDLVKSINARAKNPVDDDRVEHLFSALWPSLEQSFKVIPAPGDRSPIRSREDIIEELVTSVRGIDRRLGDIESALSGGSKEQDLIQLNALEDILEQAETVAQGASKNPERVTIATTLSEFCTKRIKTLFIEKVLADDAREYARRLLGRADALRTLAGEKIRDEEKSGDEE